MNTQATSDNVVAALPVLRVRLQQPLPWAQLPRLRAAVSFAMGGMQAPATYHHHRPEGGHVFAYPQLQYKLVGGQPVIWAFGEGIGALESFLAKAPATLQLGGQPYALQLGSVVAQVHTLRYWQSPIPFRIRRWLALSQENHRQYSSLPPDGQQALLSRILVGNVLAAGKAMGIHYAQPLQVADLCVERSYRTHYKQQPFLAIEATFGLNLNLPDLMGLGKLTSVGYGVVRYHRAATAPSPESPDS